MIGLGASTYVLRINDIAVQISVVVSPASNGAGVFREMAVNSENPVTNANNDSSGKAMVASQ